MSVETLREGEEVFRQLAENIREVFFVFTPNPPRMVYASPSYEETFTKPRQEFYRRADTWIDYIDPQDRSHVQACLKNPCKAVRMGRM